jgi:hypothetical protein
VLPVLYRIPSATSWRIRESPRGALGAPGPSNRWAGLAKLYAYGERVTWDEAMQEIQARLQAVEDTAAADR